MKEKIRTVITVVFLSCLIWVLAERAVTQKETVRVNLELTNNREDLLLECLGESGRPQPANNIEVILEVQGPSGKIQAVRGEPFRLSIPLDMGKYAPSASGPQDYPLLVAEDLFSKGLPYKDGFLTVVKSSPPRISIRVSPLVQRSLPVRVYDQDRIELTDLASIEPSTVQAYVLENQMAEAEVVLTPDQQRKASQNPIQVPVQVLFAGRQTPKFVYTVQLKLIERRDWPVVDIKLPRVGIILPSTMAGQWRVVIDKIDDLKEYAPIKFRGPAQAAKDYTDSQYHLVLEIRETDNDRQPIYRPLRYYLPEGMESSIEILDRKQIPIECHLEPLGTTLPTP